MRLLRLIGWLLILVALFLLSREAFAWLDDGAWTIERAGELWTDLHPESLAAVENSASDLAPWARSGFDTLMGWPAWAAIGGIGLLFRLARSGRRSNGRKRYFKS